MFDPNEILSAVRQAVDRVLHGEHLDDETAADVALRFRRLDEHLSGGGGLPNAWSQAPRPMTRVPMVGDRFIDVPDDEPEPLGGPVPGVDGSHLPEGSHE